MRRITAFILAAVLSGLCSCGQTDPESSAEKSVSEASAPAETATEAETSKEPASEPETTEFVTGYGDAPILPYNVNKVIEDQLTAFKEKDFEKWAEATEFNALCDMILEQYGIGEGAEAQDSFYVMEQLAASFSSIVESMPEGFSEIDSFEGKVENITLTESMDDGTAKSELYSFDIAGTSMSGEFGVDHYDGTAIVILNDVTAD